MFFLENMFENSEWKKKKKEFSFLSISFSLSASCPACPPSSRTPAVHPAGKQLRPKGISSHRATCLHQNLGEERGNSQASKFVPIKESVA